MDKHDLQVVYYSGLYHSGLGLYGMSQPCVKIRLLLLYRANHSPGQPEVASDLPLI